MLYKLLGFAWYAYPDDFGGEAGADSDPGHPFANATGGVTAEQEVLYFKRVNPEDVGISNRRRDHAFLILTRTQLHPKLAQGWESEAAVLTEGFKTHDGKVRMTRLLARHQRHAGVLVECELRVEHG